MITILCSGSRGDFQPYIALAQELKKMGKNVRIAGMREFEDFVKSYNIDFYPIQADFSTLNVDPKMLEEARSADNVLKMLLTFNKMKKYGIHVAHEYYAACEGSDLIVYHPGMTLGYFAAQKLNIPAVLASPFPMHHTKERLSVISYGRQKANRITTHLSYSLLQSMLWMASKTSVVGLWKNKFNSLPENFAKPYENHTKTESPAIVSCSNYVFSRPKDWNKNIHQYGYWFVEEPEVFTPPDKLKQFLDDGEKPVYIGFGSVFHKDKKEEFVKLIVDTLSKIHKRGIISGMGEIENLPDNIISVGAMPHTWLFEQVSAVCHHGGAGTTAAGFRAGVPSVIIPFSNDQFAWAHRAFDLGVGAKPIPAKELSAKRLAEAIQYAHQKSIKKNAIQLSQNISTENGARDSAMVIVDCLERNMKNVSKR